MILLAEIDIPDQSERMRRLVWSFAVHICPKTRSHGVAHVRTSALFN